MSNNTQSLAGAGGSKPALPTLPHRDNITTIQLNNLFVAFAHLGQFLLTSKMQSESSETVGGALDGGVQAAVEATLINCCNRIDDIFKDTERWSLNDHNKLEAAFCNVYSQHAALLKAQTQTYEEINSPHHRFNPVLKHLIDGSWLAVVGDINDIDNAVCGVGDSPAQALEAFDAMFEGKVPEQVINWLKKKEAKTDGQPDSNVIPLTNSETTNEKTELDPSRDNPTPNPPPPRKKHPRNRPSAESDGS